jgi:tRNA(Ile)-lysidine synthase
MTALSKAALTLEELAAALAAIGGFESRPAVAVAVSGGPDSLALMLLADRWARRHGGVAWGLTVDHGLRPESAAETRVVAGWLAARNIPHETLTWDAAKPASGIQEAAREARYRLLAEWCRRRGVLHLLTAHHREDQAETYLIRRRAGSGPDGLAAMSAARELPGCRLVRPLLAVPRARLGALLAAEGQPFLSDPSNANPAFERSRLRQIEVVPLSCTAGEGGPSAQRLVGEGLPGAEAVTRLARGVASHPLPHCGRGVTKRAALGG